MSDFDHLMGWRHDEEGIRRVAATMPYPVFAQAAPHLMGDGTDKDIFLYLAWKDVLKDYPAYIAQQIGDCTSFGTGHAIDLLQCVQIAIGKKAQEFQETCTEALYGDGRRIANMLGGGDGCYGSALAKAATQYGVVPRKEVGPYSGQRAQSWGATGTPDDVNTKASKHKIQTTSMVSTWEELCAALSNGYPVTVCSNQGFTMQRDQNGVCYPQGSWGHCMMIAGVRNSTGHALICQSWGPNTPSGPLANDQPNFSFWAPKDTVSAMISLQDSWAFSSFDGYPGQPLPSNWTQAGWSGF